MTDHMTAAEYSAMKQPKSKFHNIPVTIDDIRFPSILEANYYCNLKILLRQGEIKAFERQVRFDIGAGRKYVADFVVEHNDGSIEVVEVKGYETAVWRLKKALFIERYPDIKLTVVKRR